jgi:hypothetical protein
MEVKRAAGRAPIVEMRRGNVNGLCEKIRKRENENAAPPAF